MGDHAGESPLHGDDHRLWLFADTALSLLVLGPFWATGIICLGLGERRRPDFLYGHWRVNLLSAAWAVSIAIHYALERESVKTSNTG